jgi:tetraacyldisaccharide 4'-kinase
MIFFKPKFWDKNKISFFAILLFPFTLLIKVLIFFKPYLTKNYNHSIPIICVGNIYIGGTGKTPLTIEIFSILKNLNMNPVFIRKKNNLYEDEARLQKSKGPIYQNKKRNIAIKEAIKNNANVVILDDGFQDLSVKKNLSIVCFNEKKWIGNGLTIPSGPLRESLSALKRADYVFINGNKNLEIENKIKKINKKIKFFYIKHKPKNISKYKNKKITAFAGIGSPENFFNTLRNVNANIVDEIKFPDHYQYSKKDLEKLIAISKRNNTILLTTEKDYFRINKKFDQNIDFLEISTEIKNRDSFIDEIKNII